MNIVSKTEPPDLVVDPILGPVDPKNGLGYCQDYAALI
jgi:hypothetical protein